ncbi:MAG TPA: hypothetical protein VFM55_15815 [Micromonosporaceae bacterium]|nr:hypothetical protein [Micromonosporaceae bacterium]
MRHLWSLIAGVVIAPLVWGLLAIGQPQSSETVAEWEQQDTIYTGDLLKPAAFLAVAAILLGLVATLRFSPAGALVAGLLFLAPAVGLFVDPASVRDGLPDDFTLAGQTVHVRTPLDNGTLLLLGLLLVVAAFSVQRWRRWPVAEPDAETEPETEVLPGPSGEPTDPATEPLTVPADSSPWRPSTPTPPASTPPASTSHISMSHTADDEVVTTPWRLSSAEPTERRSPAEPTGRRSPAEPTGRRSPTEPTGRRSPTEPTERRSPAPSVPVAPAPPSAPPAWPPREPAERASTADSPWAGPPARRDDTA